MAEVFKYNLIKNRIYSSGKFLLVLILGFCFVFQLQGQEIPYTAASENLDCSIYQEGEPDTGYLLCAGYKAANDIFVYSFMGSYVYSMSFVVMVQDNLPSNFTLEVYSSTEENSLGTSTGMVETFNDSEYESEYRGQHPSNSDFSVYEITFNFNPGLDLVNLTFEDMYFWLVLEADCTLSHTVYWAAYDDGPNYESHPIYHYSPNTNQWEAAQSGEGIMTLDAGCTWIDIEYYSPLMDLKITDENDDEISCVNQDDFYYVSVYLYEGSGNSNFTLTDNQGITFPNAEMYEYYTLGPYLPGSSHTIVAVGNQNSWLGVTGHIIFEDDYNICETIATEKNIFEDFVYYPNPFRTTLNIKNPTPLDRVQIYNIKGQLIEDFNPSDLEFSLESENLSSGIYFLKIYKEEYTQVFKLIKEF